MYPRAAELERCNGFAIVALLGPQLGKWISELGAIAAPGLRQMRAQTLMLYIIFYVFDFFATF